MLLGMQVTCFHSFLLTRAFKSPYRECENTRRQLSDLVTAAARCNDVITRQQLQSVSDKLIQRRTQVIYSNKIPSRFSTQNTSIFRNVLFIYLFYSFVACLKTLSQ
jgi:hypothetical protein